MSGRSSGEWRHCMLTTLAPRFASPHKYTYVEGRTPFWRKVSARCMRGMGAWLARALNLTPP